MRLTLVGLLLFASTALGQQTVTLTVSNQQAGQEVLIGKDQCATTRTVTWTRTANSRICENLYIFLTPTGSCAARPGTRDVTLETLSTTDTDTTGTANFTAGGLLARAGFGEGGAATTCESETVEREFKLCASTGVTDSVTGACSNNGNFTSVGNVVDVTYDPQPPDVPTVTDAIGLDEALNVRISVPEGANRFVVEVTPVAGGDTVTVERGVEEQPIRVENLMNDVPYNVRARAIDLANNPSDFSAPLVGTPIASNGFYEEYLGAGGKETGGCGATGGGLMGGAALAAVMFWLSSRRNRS